MLALWVLSIAIHAQADDWSDGNAAFERGDYGAALRYFEAARDAGISGPAVHYNIAVCQYKLEQYAEAGQTFAFIAGEYPGMAGLAEYNLGLVAQRTGDTDAAVEHFLRAYRTSPDNETIRVLASNQLAEIAPEKRAAARWSGAFGVRAGYDDNIVLRDTAGISSGVTSESPMLDVFASISRPFPSLQDGLTLEGSAYAIRYFDADDFDQHEITAGARYEWQPGSWRIATSANAGAGWLGGDAFDRRVGLAVDGYRSLGGDASVYLAYYYDDISDGDDVFAGIGGTRQQLVARYRKYLSDGRRLLVRLRHEDNDRRDPGVSPTRTGLSIDYRYLPDAGWGFEVGASHRRSRFSEITVSRTENLLATRFALTRHLANSWILLVEYRYSDNDSSDPEFSYQQNVLTVSAMRTF